MNITMNTTTKFTLYFHAVAWLFAIPQLLTTLHSQERFRSESWQFDRRASVHDLNTGSAAQRYSAALGIFIRSLGRDEDGIEDAIEAMEAVYDEARSAYKPKLAAANWRFLKPCSVGSIWA